MATKKYRVTDAEGNVTEVEELDEEVTDPVTEPAGIATEQHDDDGVLSADEIAAVKKLAAVADKLVALLPTEPTSDEDEDDKLKNDDDDDVCDDDVTDPEKLLDTDEDKKASLGDSKKSLGAIARKATHIDDEAVHAQSVDDAWNRRFNGGK